MIVEKNTLAPTASTVRPQLSKTVGRPGTEVTSCAPLPDSTTYNPGKES